MSAKTVFIMLSVLGVGGVAYWFFSQKSDEHLKLIPKDAIFVGTADWMELSKKADVAKLKELEFFKGYIEKTQIDDPELNRHLTEIANNPESTGINLFSDTYFYVTNLENVTYTGMAVAIKDVKRFEQMLMRLVTNVHIQVGRNCHYTPISSQTVMAWDEHSAFIATADSYRLEDDWQRMFAEWSFGQLEEQTMKTHAVFQDLMDEDRDVRAFINGPSILQTMKREFKGEAAIVPKSFAFLEDNFMMLGLEFEDDAIVFDLNVNALNEDYKSFAEIGREGISAGHLNLLSDKALSTMIFSLDMEKLMTRLMEFPDARKEIDKMLQEMEMSQQDFVSALSGEFSVEWRGLLPMPEKPKALTTAELFKLTPEEYYAYQFQTSYQSNEPALAYNFNFTSSNKDIVKRFMDRMTSKELVTKNTNGVYAIALGGRYNPGYTFQMVENPVGFSFTNDTMLIGQLQSGGAGGPVSGAKDLFAGKSCAAFYNFQLLKDSVYNNAQIFNAYGMAQYTGYAVSIFDTGTLYIGHEKSELKINLQKGPDNSLHEFIAHIARLGTSIQKAEEDVRYRLEQEPWLEGDADIAPPPVVEEWHP